MKKLFIVTLILGIAGLCVVATAQEESPNLSIGVKAGTPGLGVELGIPFTTNVGGRFGINYFTYSYDTDQEGIEYDADLTLLSFGALLDWYPTGSIFRLTGGLFYNGNEVEGKAKGDDIEIGDNTYDDVKVKAKVDFDDLSPYIGIGWDTSFGAEKQWGFICDLGIIYHGTPNVSFKAEGAGISDDDIEKEKEDLEDALEDYRWYPVITLGFTYRF